MAKVQRSKVGKSRFWSWFRCHKFVCSGCMRLYLWVIFIVILCIILWLIYPGNRKRSVTHTREEYNKTMGTLSPGLPKLAPSILGCVHDKCNVFCYNSDNLHEDLYNAANESPCTLIDMVHIERQAFPNSTLTTDCLVTDKQIVEIAISYSNLTTIQNEAFNRDDFRQTQTLSLFALPIKILPAGALLGLSMLDTLRIECELERINRGFFQPVSSSLRKLKMSLMKKTVPFDDMFGIARMTNLVHLDLSYNNFIFPLSKSGFYSLLIVNFLNLSNSRIRAIYSDAFYPIKDTLKYLDLSNNELVTFNPNVVYSLLIEKKAYISLRDNPWHCDCDLKPLFDLYTNHKDMFIDTLYCKSPEEWYGHIFNSIPDLCYNYIKSSEGNIPNATKPSFSTSKDDSSHALTTKLATLNPDENDGSTGLTLPVSDYFKLACFNDSTNNGNNEQSDDVDFLYLVPPHNEFSINIRHNNSVEITINKFRGRMIIIWYDDPDDYPIGEQYISDYGCRVPHNKTVIIENLKDNVTYTFCLIPEGKTKIAPFNCLPYHIPVSKHTDNVWIEKDDRELAVVVAAIILLISFCIGGAAGYLIIRNFPDLLKGSKHVLIVKKGENPGISTISKGEHSRKSRLNVKQKKIQPPYLKFTLDNVSNYQTPIAVDECEMKRRSTNTSNRYEPRESLPYSPPPLPKRNSEPTYSSLGIARLKSGIV